ncbi:purine-nucleoside phosphorylase [Christensenellaceae bacterium NSJ-44]|uniref:Purine nucleoside phosphorylase n=1 Tax=Luoshenia tenuis TaxID=2763654 RepID=A0A926D004_9FIRM|nr:purine-nucleoside phosphorylase [Luoshenia tenuis]MBC8528852.1 purine-nucleoside phosphorylase [Luoshenia tenuis]
MSRFEQAVQAIKAQTQLRPKVAVILGSGLGNYAKHCKKMQTIPYAEIPHFPKTTVPGHAGQLAFGRHQGQDIVLMCGRFHYYEGYDMAQVTFPTRVLSALGVETLIVTNAAGGVNQQFQPGDLMAIEDHINFSGNNPLIGANLDAFGPRFPDMSRAYDRELIALAGSAAKQCGFSLQKGVYAMMSGPSFETPAEIRMLRTLGADAVGMSTVPEVIVANHCGMRVLGLSCISNMAAGILDQPLSHQEVMETGKAVEARFTALIDTILAAL